MTESRLSTALADRYRIERELGQGGMATVYVAEVVRPEAAGRLHARNTVASVSDSLARHWGTR